MSLLFLHNTAGSYATSYDLGSGTIASGYNLYNSISGTRGKTERTQKSSSEILRQYHYAANHSIDYVVIARADLMLTNNTTRVRLKQKSSGGSWSYISGIDYNPITSANLIGARNQDLVIACSPSDLRGIALSTIPVTGSEASEISKFYGCASVSTFGVPNPEYSWQNTTPRTVAKTINSGLEYEIERTFTLQYSQLKQDDIDAFYNLDEVLNAPFFIYDPNSYLWSWKLEHVIITEVQEYFVDLNNYDLSLTFGRLKHYD